MLSCIHQSPNSTLFPYTTLFRSRTGKEGRSRKRGRAKARRGGTFASWRRQLVFKDRKSTRLNSSHLVISYAVFCLIKKMNNSFKKINEKYSEALERAVFFNAGVD